MYALNIPFNNLDVRSTSNSVHTHRMAISDRQKGVTYLGLVFTVNTTSLTAICILTLVGNNDAAGQAQGFGVT